MTLDTQPTTELRSICPFCDSLTQTGRQNPKFYYNPMTELYYCFHCEAKGKGLTDEQLEGLVVIDEITKKTFDYTVLSKLKTNAPELDEFIRERLNGVSEFKGTTLCYSEERKAIAILNRDYNGDLVGIKYRFIDPNAEARYKSENGSQNEGSWFKGEDSSKLLIVEGEIDALTAKLLGFKGSVLATQTKKLHESQLNAIKTFKNVFLCPDKDLGGIELKNSVERLLSPFKTIIEVSVDSDCKDINELLQRRGYEYSSELVKVQTKTSVERDTRSLRECIPELLSFLSDERNTRGDSTGWKSIDALLGGGLRVCEMSVINAFAKTGKSSFINNLIHNLAKSGKSIALASFEMDPARSIYPTLISIALKVNIRNLSDLDREDLINEYSSEFEYLNNIISLRRFGYTSWEEVEEWAHLMKVTRNIDYLVLDHAGFMVEKMTDAEENQILAKNIKKLSNTLGIHILVVVQAPKTKDGLSIQTSYGGLAWGMNSDNFFILERSKDNEMELRVKLEASRYPGSNPSSTPALLYYDRESCMLTEE